MGFNSLDAQREACESYIASQKHEGSGSSFPIITMMAALQAAIWIAQL